MTGSSTRVLVLSLEALTLLYYEVYIYRQHVFLNFPNSEAISSIPIFVYLNLVVLTVPKVSRMKRPAGSKDEVRLEVIL